MDTFWYVCITAWYSAVIGVKQSMQIELEYSSHKTIDSKSFQNGPCNKVNYAKHYYMCNR